jgi:hypothetical protein
MKTNIYFLSNLANLFLELQKFLRNLVEKIKTCILCSVTFFYENRVVYEKYYRAGQATGDNMAHAHCMLDA